MQVVELHHPHLLRAVVDNAVRQQPLLLLGSSQDVLKPVVARDNARRAIEEDPINISHRGALAKRHDVIVGLKDGLVVMDALAGYLIEEDGLVFRPLELLQARILDALAWHNKDVLRTEERLRRLSLAQARRASKHKKFEPRVLSPDPKDCVLSILQSPQVDIIHGTEILESSR